MRKAVVDSMNISGKTFLVCGASGALGSELVQLLRGKGATVLGTASSNESACLLYTSDAADE